MNRLPKQLISMLVVLCMVMSFFGVLASAETTTTATLVTDVSTLKAGDQIIIAATEYDYALSTTQNTNNRGQAAITRGTDGTITVGSDAQVITLETGTVDGTFAFNVGESQYLYAPSSSANNLKTTATLADNASWTVTVDASTGIAGIVAAGTTTRNTLRYNSSSGLFSCYAESNTQKDLSIYLVTGTGDSGDSGTETTGYTATLVTDGSTLNAGDQIIIVAAEYDYALSTTQNTSNRGQAAVTKDPTAGTVTYDDSTQIITLAEGAATGTLAMTVGDAQYLYASSSSANQLKTATELTENASWTITVDATTGVASIVAAGTNTRNTLRYNSSSALFACYSATNTQKDLSIYMVTNTEGTGGSTGGDSSDTGSDTETDTSSYTATLVTDITNISIGDQIIIVALEYDYALSTTQNTNNRGQAAVTKDATAGTVTFGDDVQIITLAAGATDTTLAMTVGDAQYLYASSSSANQLKTATELTENASWTITVDATTGAASIVAAGTNTINTLRYNSSSGLFSCYAATNSQKDICIYMVSDTAGSGGTTGGSGSDTGSDTETDTSSYTATLVTDIANISIGDQIIIVALEYDYALGTTQNTNNRGQAAVTKTDSTLTFGTDTELITLESGNTDGTYALGVGTSQFLSAVSSSGNYLRTVDTLSDDASWTITIDASTGAASIVAAGTYTRNTLRYNSSSGLFACYDATNSQKDLAIYLVSGSTSSGSGTTDNVEDAGNSDSSCNHNWSNGACTKCGEAYILMITTPTGYTSADQVVYNIVDGYVANWGARGEEIDFLSTYATNFYTGNYTFDVMSGLSGGTSTSNAASSELYAALQTLMESKHTTFTKYSSSSSSLDCRYYYLYTDCLNGDTSTVSTIYRGLLVDSTWDGGSTYNQEHIWPHSKCIGTTSTDIGDIMHLRPANPSENSSRNNTAYGESDGYYDPGLSVRGDCARTVLYLYTRWGNTDYMWGTDGVIESVDILLKWIEEDPVDTWEMGHNDAVQSITGTRNVFVDYPEYAWLLFGQEVPADLTTPSSGNAGSDTPSCSHSYTSSVTTAATCTTTGVRTYTCTLCGSSYTATIAALGHSYSSVVTAATCTADGYTTYTCATCGDSYTGNTTAAIGHSYSNGTCANCGEADASYVDPNADYYLIGYINGADYGCEGDYANLGDYKFVNGQLVVTFDCDSYVFIKTGDNAKWYMFQSYVTETTGTLYNTNTGTAEKMYVPGGVEITFNLTVNADSLTLSYTTADVEVTVPTISLSYPTLAFEDEILYNAYFTVDDASSVVEMGMITFSSKLTDGTIADAVDVISGYTTSGSNYIVHSNGIPAKNLGDALYFKVYAKLSDGTYAYSAVAGYNAVAYAKTILNSSSSSDAAKALVVAMLNYGAAAQTYFGYNTSSLMNASLTAAQLALVGDYSESMVASVVTCTKSGSFVNNGGYSTIYPTVSFESAFAINYYFATNYTPDSAPTFYYWDAATYNSVSTLTAANATGTITMTLDGDQWYGTVSGIAAKEIDQTYYTAGIYTSGGTTYTSPVISYSLGKYCQTVAANGEAFGAATAVYGYYAKAYFA